MGVGQASREFCGEPNVEYYHTLLCTRTTWRSNGIRPSNATQSRKQGQILSKVLSDKMWPDLQACSAMLLATIFLTASADAVSIHRILPAAAAAAKENRPLASRPSRSLEEFPGVNQKQVTEFNPYHKGRLCVTDDPIVMFDILPARPHPWSPSCVLYGRRRQVMGARRRTT